MNSSVPVSQGYVNISIPRYFPAGQFILAFSSVPGGAEWAYSPRANEGTGFQIINPPCTTHANCSSNEYCDETFRCWTCADCALYLDLNCSSRCAINSTTIPSRPVYEVRISRAKIHPCESPLAQCIPQSSSTRASQSQICSKNAVCEESSAPASGVFDDDSSHEWTLLSGINSPGRTPRDKCSIVLGKETHRLMTSCSPA